MAIEAEVAVPKFSRYIAPTCRALLSTVDLNDAWGPDGPSPANAAALEQGTRPEHLSQDQWVVLILCAALASCVDEDEHAAASPLSFTAHQLLSLPPRTLAMLGSLLQAWALDVEVMTWQRLYCPGIFGISRI